MPAIGLALGFAARARWGWGSLARPVIWAAATVPVVAALGIEIVVSLRRREVGLDIVAFLSMTGALALGETLAGAVVALMYAGGQFLEGYAARRARREMTALLERAPKFAMRYGDGGLTRVAIEALGDRLLVRRGEVVPVDGHRRRQRRGGARPIGAHRRGDASAARRRRGGDQRGNQRRHGVRSDRDAGGGGRAPTPGSSGWSKRRRGRRHPWSGSPTASPSFVLVATLAIAGAAWLATGDAVRWLAVMVVATPCPLILAVPVAIIAGVSRAARIGVLIKGGGALEVLAPTSARWSSTRPGR